MPSIRQQLKIVRRAALKNDLAALGWMVYAALLIVFMVMIMVEAVFYLSPELRRGVWVGLLVLLGVGLGSLLVVILMTLKNRFPRYRFTRLARLVGELHFSQTDTVLNALQLEESAANTSRELSQSFIDQTATRLERLVRPPAELVKSARRWIRSLTDQPVQPPTELVRPLADPSVRTPTELVRPPADTPPEQPAVLDFKHLFPTTARERWKKRTLGLLAVSVLVLGVTWQHSPAALYRWFHPGTAFAIPQPFAILALSGDVSLLGGETVRLDFTCVPEAPEPVQLEFIPAADGPDSVHLELIPLAGGGPDSLRQTFAAGPDSNGFYRFQVTEVNQGYRYRAFVPADYFWQAWKEVSSPTYTISVTDRPVIEDFAVTIVPPPYSRLPARTQAANQAEVQGLKGSTIAIRLTSNRPLGAAHLQLDDRRLPLDVRGQRAAGELTLDEEGSFHAHLEDTRGIINRNPIPYHIQVIPDLDPELRILQPAPILELGSDQLVPLKLTIEDDFGFSNLQIGYELVRPSYIPAEPFISVYQIPIKPYDLNQEITTVWDLNELGLMPEDEVHYHFELYDNDAVSGPKKFLSSTYIVRLPSLADLYRSFAVQEGVLLDEALADLENLETLREQLDKAELELLKSEDLNWDQQQQLKNTLEQAKDQVKKLQGLSRQLEELNQTGEKHGLFSSDLLQKFRQLQELVQEILTPELLKSLDWVEEALQKMDPKDLLAAMKDLGENVDQLERELDRFIDIFKRIQAEQLVDEVRQRLEALLEQQERLDESLGKSETDASTLAEHVRSLAEEERRIREEFSQVRELMEEAAGAMEEINAPSAEGMRELRSSDLARQTGENLSSTFRALRNADLESSQSSSAAAVENLRALGAEAHQIQLQFQRETTAEMAARFRDIMGDILILSKAQEALRQTTQSIPPNSARLGQVAGRQQVLQDQLKQIMTRLMDLSRETFLVNPEMGKAIGMAFAQMEAAKQRLGDRNGGAAGSHQGRSMVALNESARAIYNATRQMQASGSTSGFAEFLERMQALTSQQEGINRQGLELALGQLAAAYQEALMKRVLKRQQAVRKSLGEMLEEMRRSGEQGLGDLSGAAREMDEVIRDLEARKYTRRTVERQQRILSRMLDSQKALTQRGVQEERRSRPAEEFFYAGPAGLPEDRGQRRSLTLEALDRALKSDYPRDYQTMIRRYFNTLSQEEEKLPLAPDPGENR